MLGQRTPTSPPVIRITVSKAVAEGLAPPENGLVDFKALPARYRSSQVDGRTLMLGNHRLIEEQKLYIGDRASTRHP